jgi:hypothetical protein
MSSGRTPKIQTIINQGRKTIKKKQINCSVNTLIPLDGDKPDGKRPLERSRCRREII